MTFYTQISPLAALVVAPEIKFCINLFLIQPGVKSHSHGTFSPNILIVHAQLLAFLEGLLFRIQ